MGARKKKTARTMVLAACLSLTAACQPERPSGWTEATHGDTAPPAYEDVFDDTVVHRYDVVIDPSVHQAMLDDLETKIAGGAFMFDGSGEEPIWAPVRIGWNGHTWWHVGMRYKGNSSLVTAWRHGVRKLGFRLDFDQFEDDYPEIRNQRFNGFRRLTFSNAFSDASLIRDKVAADLFRATGVPAAYGAFAAVYLDAGEGPVYAGLYTVIEDPSDAMLAYQLGATGANLYKPEGTGSDWTEFAASGFSKKTNEATGFEDAEAAIAALHADRTDAVAWRAGLEAAFDVEGFLRWLAVNQAMVNWDTYGCIAHNYYLYGQPDHGGRLAWIPWDLNEALRPVGTTRPGCAAESVMLDEVGEDKPLIRWLLDDPTYREAYRNELTTLLAGPFSAAALDPALTAAHELVAPWVVGPEAVEALPYSFLPGPGAFLGSLSGNPTALLDHVADRRLDVQAALGL
jgi:spore coat protein CotH